MNVNRILVAAFAGIAMTTAVACAAMWSEKSAGDQIDDSALTAKVKTALVADPITGAHDIDVEVERGVVQLNGFVDSQTEKSQATTVATGIGGVKEVRNNLAVNTGDESVGELIDDSALTAKVKLALIRSPDTKAYQINVETKEGVVQLSGFVDSHEAKAAATIVALTVSGVKDVRNDISVKAS